MLPWRKTLLFWLVFRAAIPPNAIAQSLQQQAICAAQAKKVFQTNEADWKREEKEQPNLRVHSVSHDYQSHYNTKLNRCLILETRISEMDGKLSTLINLYDAFERRNYADWMSKPGKADYEPLVCALTPIYGQTEYCSSKDAFNSFVAKYMGTE